MRHVFYRDDGDFGLFARELYSPACARARLLNARAVIKLLTRRSAALFVLLAGMAKPGCRGESAASNCVSCKEVDFIMTGLLGTFVHIH